MTTRLDFFSKAEVDNLRIALDKAALTALGDTVSKLRTCLDIVEDADAAQAEHADQVTELENKLDELRDALREARGQLERIRSTAETATEPTALERHGEIRLLAEEAVGDISSALD